MISRSLVVVLVILTGLFGARVSRAAAIVSEVSSSDPSVGVITLVGEIQEGDGESFARAAEKYSKAIVIFSSPGGNAFAGLQIGQVIRSRGFATIVPSGTFCASACALAWLGGARRFIQDKGLVGFHAVYIVQSSGEKTETGAGNALVGAYLSRLGLSDKAILYIEQASPDTITWLTPSDAQEVGIAVDGLPEDAQPDMQTGDVGIGATPAAPTSNTDTAFVPPTFAPLVSATTAPASAASRIASAAPSLLPKPTAANAAQSPAERAQAFLSDYYSSWSEANEQALSYFQTVYAPRVDFYGSQISRDKLLALKRAFAERWPLRVYTVRPGTTTISCDAAGQGCKISGIVEWDCRSVARQAHSTGSAQTTLSVNFTEAGPQIFAESGSVISKG